MSMSGIEIDEEVKTLFNDMKLRSVHKYATFKIENKKKVIVDFKEEPKLTEDKETDKLWFEKLQKKLTERPTYILYDFGFITKTERKVSKLAFIFWCPDTSKIGDKMIYASTKDAVKKAFTGIALEFQANDMSDMDYDTLSAEVEKKT